MTAPRAAMARRAPSARPAESLIGDRPGAPRWSAPRAAAVLAALLAGGCLGGLGGDAPPPVRTYALSPPLVVANRAGAPSIAVEELRADAPYDDRRMIVRAGAYRVAYDEANQWAAAPGALAADYLRRAYQACGRFGLVLSAPDAGTRAILGGRVLAFERVDRGARGASARVVVDLDLRDAQTGRVVWTRRAEQSITLSGRPSPESLAAALSEALARIAAATAPDLAAAVAAGG